MKILSLYSTRSAYCVFHSGLQGILMGSGALHAAQWSIQGNPFHLNISAAAVGLASRTSNALTTTCREHRVQSEVCCTLFYATEKLFLYLARMSEAERRGSL